MGTELRNTARPAEIAENDQGLFYFGCVNFAIAIRERRCSELGRSTAHSLLGHAFPNVTELKAINS